MPTEKPRVTFTVSKETLDEIDRYRFASRSKINHRRFYLLLSVGLRAVKRN